MKLFVDTNVFLRFFLNDHKTQSPATRKLFKEADKGNVALMTSSLIVAEIIFTLDSVYRLSKPDIIKIIHAIMFFKGLEITEKDVLLQSISFYEKKNIDFIDAFAAAYCFKNNLNVCSFDKDFDKIKEMKRVDP